MKSTGELDELTSIHMDLGLMLLEWAIDAETLGKQQKAVNHASHAWSHFVLAENVKYRKLACDDYINNPAKPGPVYGGSRLINMAHDFAKCVYERRRDKKELYMLNNVHKPIHSSIS